MSVWGERKMNKEMINQVGTDILWILFWVLLCGIGIGFLIGRFIWNVKGERKMKIKSGFYWKVDIIDIKRNNQHNLKC